MKSFSALPLAFALTISLCSAATIDFEDRSGPSLFGQPAQVLVYPDATFTGGTILTNTANLPANQTSVYGTAHFGNASYDKVLTVTFTDPIENFFLDVLNGLTTSVTYRLEDNDGHSAEFTLEPNLQGGKKTQIGFAATGDVVTVFSKGLPDQWDFFIDNVNYNAPLPPDLVVPEPSTWAMLIGGLGLMALRLRKPRSA